MRRTSTWRAARSDLISHSQLVKPSVAEEPSSSLAERNFDRRASDTADPAGRSNPVCSRWRPGSIAGYNQMTLAMREQPARGAKPSIPSEQLRRLIERVAFQANYTAKRTSPEAVHDLRVAIRRLDQALVVFKVYLPRKPAKRIRRELKPVFSAAGTVRNCDIAAKILTTTGTPDAAALGRTVRTRRQEAERSLLTILKRLSVRTRVSKWCDGLGLNPPQCDFPASPRTLATRTLPRITDRFWKAGEAAVSHSSGEKLHNFRIRTKKFRYTLELFLPVYGSAAEECLREVKAIQTVLGVMNDYRTVLSIAADAKCSKKLQSSLKNSERRKIRQFRALWTERFTSPAAAGWIGVLRGQHDERRIAPKPIASATAQAQKDLAARA